MFATLGKAGSLMLRIPLKYSTYIEITISTSASLCSEDADP